MSAEPTHVNVPSTAKPSPRLSVGIPSIALAATVMVVLFSAVGYAAVTSSEADRANKREAFENVLNLSSAELESKSVAELKGYHLDIVNAGHYSLAIGNISGYDDAIIDRELDQVNELIARKTDH